MKSKDPEIGIAAPEAKLGKPLPPTRPYLYDVGKGVLMLSVAQGPDAIFEPYGVLRSTDAGKTWEPWASPCAMSSISMTLASGSARSNMRPLLSMRHGLPKRCFAKEDKPRRAVFCDRPHDLNLRSLRSQISAFAKIAEINGA